MGESVRLYLTALEGASPANVGLYASQVAEMLAMYNGCSSDPFELVAFIRHRDMAHEYVMQLCENYRVKCHVLGLRDFFPAFDALHLAAVTLKELCPVGGQTIIVAREVAAGAIACRAAEMAGRDRVKVVLDKRGLPAEESFAVGAQPARALTRYAVMKWLEDYTIRRVDGIRFVTTNLKALVCSRQLRVSTLPSCVTPTGADLLYREDRTAGRVSRLVYSGGAARYQRLDAVATFMSSCLDRGIASECSIYSSLDLAAVSPLLAAHPRIRFVPYLPHSDSVAALTAADAGLCFRDDSIINQVASPTKIAEYLSAGLRVIYTGRIGVVEDLDSTGAGGLCIRAGSFLENSGYVRPVDAPAWAAASNYFSWERHARQINHLIAQVWGFDGR